MIAHEQGTLGERIAASDFSKDWNVTKADPYFGDLKLVHKVTGQIKHIEVKTITTPSATVRKDRSQHLVFADYVLVIRLDTGEKYLIPRKEIKPTQQRIYVSPTSKFGKFLGATL